jgi:hypothetical protein
MPPVKLDLSPGSVLHIKEFSSRGHPPKNKYVLIIGSHSDSVIALGFLISSQLHYLQLETHKQEIVRVPDRATSFLRRESIIQCFELERLSVSELRAGAERGRVTHEGRLTARYLHKVRECVEKSRLLAQEDIDLALNVLPKLSPHA